MANQIITTDSNHDSLTGRAAGEDITIQLGATLTIDSCPHLTTMGILGDITMTAGTVHIDGRNIKKVSYHDGSGSLPAIGTAITWDSGASTGKIVDLISGDYEGGVMQVVVYTGTLSVDDVMTDGSWSADVDNPPVVGFLTIFGEDQDWGSVDAQSTLRITGDWYEVAVGDGTDSQTFELPHTGHQPAIWVETGDGTDVFQIWHRVVPSASIIFYNNINQFGTTFESGFVFDQSFGDATVTFGTSTAGGVPPDGARIRIPNVHIGTTTTAAPTTEVSSATITVHIGLIAPNTNLNVEIDHLNGSSCYVDFRGTNTVTISDSCWGLHANDILIQKVNATVTMSNCAIIDGAQGEAGSYLPVHGTRITDNVGGVTIDNCVIMAGENATNSGALYILTAANVAFTGTNKLVSNQQDENTMASLRGAVAVNVTAETLILLGGTLFAAAGCNNWEIDELIFGLPPGRGTTEQTINWVNLTGTQNIKISSGRKATGGANVGTIGAFLLTDTSDTWIQNFGEIDDKISGESRMTYVVSCAGITSGATLKRLYFDTLNAAASFPMLNSAANITIENCSGDYNDEIEPDANRTLHKGVHGGSGGPGISTGIEDDLINVIGTCFYDLFTSDTTGFVGLVFNDKGNFHAGDVTITSGTPFFNGLGDLKMNTVGDQVVYEFPYWILGHTGFANTTPSKIGVSAANISAEYQIDTGSGYGTLVNGSGNWDDATGAKLNAETISPSGFKIKFRFTTTTGTSQNLRGFAIYTTTTIADQKANLYPLGTVPVSITVKDINTGATITGARVFLKVTAGATIFNDLTDGSGVVEDTAYEYVGDQTIEGVVRKGDSPFYKQFPISGTITWNRSSN